MQSGFKRRPNRLIAAAFSIGLVLTAAGIGNLATFANLQTWYLHLNKPSFTPPNWVFGPAWGILYVLMIIAFWRVLSLPADTHGKRTGIASFLVQLVLNAAWSVVFFGMHSPLGGLVVIGLMIVAILATIRAFFRIDPLSGFLLIPYLAWVSFATALNAGVWMLNR